MSHRWSVMPQALESRRGVTLVVATLLLTACFDDSMNGERFVLASIEGHVLPAVEADNGEDRWVVEAETLFFSTSGQGRRTRRSRREEAGRVRSTTVKGSIDFTYELNGVDLSITHICPINANCVAGPHLIGQRIMGMLRVHQGMGAKRLLLEYRSR